MDQLAMPMDLIEDGHAEPDEGAPSLFGLLGGLPAVQLVRGALNAAFRSIGLDDSHEVIEAVTPREGGRMAICWTAPGLDLSLQFDRMGEPVLSDQFSEAQSH